MSTITPSTETTDGNFFRGRWLSGLPTEGNTPIDLSLGFLEFARTRVILKERDSRPSVRNNIDRSQPSGNLESEHSSTITCGRKESIGEESVQCISGGVQSPLDGMAAERSSERGEEKMVLNCPEQERLSKIRTILNTTGYASLSYIARETELSAEEIKALIRSHSEEVRQSFMRAENGEEVYMINTPLSSISDAWRAFRYLNAKMF